MVVVTKYAHLASRNVRRANRASTNHAYQMPTVTWLVVVCTLRGVCLKLSVCWSRSWSRSAREVSEWERDSCRAHGATSCEGNINRHLYRKDLKVQHLLNSIMYCELSYQCQSRQYCNCTLPMLLAYGALYPKLLLILPF